MMKQIIPILIIFLFISLPDQAQPPPATISGNTHINIGDTSTLYGSPSGGTWTSLTPAIATIGATSGLITGVSVGTATIWYIPPPSSYYDNGSAIITVKDPTYTGNIKANNDSTIDIYPNPPNDDIYINIHQGTYHTVLITDEVGKIIIRQQVRTTPTHIDIKALKPGLYFITLVGDNGKKVARILKT